MSSESPARNGAWLPVQVASIEPAPGRHGYVAPLVHVVMILVFALIVMVAGVVLVARIQPIPEIVDPAAAYLPGRPIPDDLVSCYWYPNIHSSACRVGAQQKETIYFVFDPDRRTIVQTTVNVQQLTLGKLMTAWGTPTGVESSGNRINVYWGKRSALIYGNSLKVDTPVTYIAYRLAVPVTFPWRGFQTLKREKPAQ